MVSDATTAIVISVEFLLRFTGCDRDFFSESYADGLNFLHGIWLWLTAKATCRLLNP